MTIAYCDSATIAGATAALDYGNYDKLHPWAIDSVKTVTALMLFHSEIYLMPSLRIDAKISQGIFDLYDFTIENMKSILSTQPIDWSLYQRMAEWSNSALDDLRTWLRNDQSAATMAVNKAKSSPSFEPWLEWSIRAAWEGHSRRLDGLFNAELLPEIAGMLNCSEQLLFDVWIRSRDEAQIKRWKKMKGEDFELAKDAYVISAVLRGRYHESIGRNMGGVVHHPIREGALVQAPAGTRTTIPVSPSVDFFLNIIFNASIKQRTSKSRIKSWIGNVEEARRNPQILRKLSESDYDGSRAMHLAAEAAQTIGIQVYPDWVKLCDVSLSLGLGALSSFVVTDWRAFLLTTATVLITKPVERAVKKASLREHKLRELASLSPGRISRNWKV